MISLRLHAEWFSLREVWTESSRIIRKKMINCGCSDEVGSGIDLEVLFGVAAGGRAWHGCQSLPAMIAVLKRWVFAAVGEIIYP